MLRRASALCDTSVERDARAKRTPETTTRAATTNETPVPAAPWAEYETSGHAPPSQ